MNFSKILRDITSQAPTSFDGTNSLKSLSNNIPVGLAGGAIAGSLVASLFASKSVRKTAKTAAKYGGTALLGGLAYKAYQDWQKNKSAGPADLAGTAHSRSQTTNQQTGNANFEQEALAHAEGANLPDSFQLALIKAMIASAKADNSIDAEEQKNISAAIDQMGLDSTAKSELYELFIRPISIDEIVTSLNSMVQKAEVYLASCLVIEIDQQSEFEHLAKLAQALELPPELEQQLRIQASSIKSA